MTDLSLADLVLLVLRRRRLVVGLPLVLALIVVGVVLVLPRSWSASTTFYPQTSGGSLSKLGGLAAQFGVNVGGGGDSPDETPDFYVALVVSDAFLREVVHEPFLVEGDNGPRPQTMVEIYDITVRDSARALKAAVDALRDDIDSRSDFKTGVVSVTVHARQPQLAVEIVQRILTRLNDYNLNYRQSRAAAERDFIGHRLEEARAELREAEGVYQGFLQRNRIIRDSPQLQFENDRLKREVDLRAQVYSTLSNSFEQARIEEVRNTPVITIVARPFRPATPDARRLALKGVLVLLAGGIIGLLIALVQEVQRQTRGEARGAQGEIDALLAETWLDLRHPWSRVMAPGIARIFGRRTAAGG